MESFIRTVLLDDISIRSGGDGRTVTAYAAIFDSETTISDQDGQYREVISPNAFTKTLAERSDQVKVMMNHGMTMQGFPSDRFAMPLGKPLEIRADSKGLLTVTRYNRSALADEVLESIQNGEITAQSFSGQFIQSSPKTPKGGFRATPNSALPLVTRSEIALREYGPAIFAAYPGASIVGVRFDRTTPSEPDDEAPLSQGEPGAAEPLLHSGRSLRDHIRAQRIIRHME